MTREISVFFMEKCRNCNSEDVRFTKHMNWGPKIKTYHYRLHCNDCKRSYHTARTKEIFDLVKGQRWILSKNAKTRMFKTRSS